jgi:hypothetical protein
MSDDINIDDICVRACVWVFVSESVNNFSAGIIFVPLQP